jgi:hypothetical protein
MVMGDSESGQDVGLRQMEGLGLEHAFNQPLCLKRLLAWMIDTDDELSHSSTHISDGYL